MNSNKSYIPPVDIPSEIVPAPLGFRVSWTWLFPLLAIIATAWLFFDNWKSLGPEIEISFREAPGIEPGKTDLICRGVQAGEVTSVRLDEMLGKVIVKVRLKDFASELAREGTDFWIEQPVVSIRGISGLESLIQGNSIHARANAGAQHWQFEFTALDEAPLMPLDAPSLVLELGAQTVPFISRGSPVFHRGTRVGLVRDKQFDKNGFPFVQVIIEEKYAETVKKNSRFWMLQAASVSVSPGQVHLNLPSISSLLDGGIAYDHFEEPQQEVKSGEKFELCNNEIDARANGPQIFVEFEDAISMREGETRVCYFGQPVGIIQNIRPKPESGKIEATLRMTSAMTPFLTSAAQFRLIRPGVTWKGITGIETIVTGPYVAFSPVAGGDSSARKFTAVSAAQQQVDALSHENGGLRILLKGKDLTNISSGSPIFHSGVPVGAILEKRSTPQGEPELVVGIRPAYAESVRKNTRFWKLPASEISVGPGSVEVQFEGLLSLLQGGIAFDSFAPSNEPAQNEDSFELFPSHSLAAAVSPPIKITFSEGQGFLPGKTQLRYLGVPVGIVEKVTPSLSKVEVEARFFHGFDFLRRAGSRFSAVHPTISLQGLSGLETLVSGIYIACIPGSGNGVSHQFVGMESIDPTLLAQNGLEIRVTTHETKIAPGALVDYNGLAVGKVTDKKLSRNGTEVLLTVKIHAEYQSLVRENSQFWNSTGMEARIGMFKVQLKMPSLVTPEGSMSFFTPDPEGPPAKQGATFSLLEKPPKELRK